MRISLKAARVNRNLTQEEFASVLGVSKKTVVSWENGTTHPRTNLIEPICNALGVCVDNIEWSR